MPNLDQQTILLAILGVVAFALLVQAIALLAIMVAVRRTARTVTEQVEEFRDEVMPIVRNTRELVTRIAPRIEDTAADLAEMASSLRGQTADIQGSATEVMERVRKQMVRIDEMISHALDAVDRATGFVTEAVAKPVRQLSGILASARAVVETLRSAGVEVPQPVQPQRRVSSDDDLMG